jgi:hypothetical protein
MTYTNHKLDKLPLSYNLSDGHIRTNPEINGIFWVNTFARGSNGHDYYIASHAMNYASDIEGALPIYRASILDITDPTYYKNFLRTADKNASFWSPCGLFNATFDGYGMHSSGKDPNQGIRTWTTLEGIDFDLTLNFSSPPMMNGALGSYWVGGGLGWEWSVPRAATSGIITIDGEKIDIVTKESFTWYDRQWGSIPDGFDWIMLHFEESDWLDMKSFTIWAWEDVVNGKKSFASVRSYKTGFETTMPVTVRASTTEVWESPDSGQVYPSEWRVSFGDDIEMLVTTPRADQVIEADPATGFPNQFSGYVEVVAKKGKNKPVKGYGAVDHMFIP